MKEDCYICKKPIEGKWDSQVELGIEMGHINPTYGLMFVYDKHISCSPSRAQYIVHERFSPVEDSREQFDKRLKSDKIREELTNEYTSAWIRLQEKLNPNWLTKDPEPVKIDSQMKNYIGRTFNITYRPETAPDGSKNIDGEIFSYRIAVDSPFKNLSRGEDYAGFAAKDANDNWHRFRWDRILKMIPISDEIPNKTVDTQPQVG